MKKLKRIELNCKTCGNIFTVRENVFSYRSPKYCSRKCYYETFNGSSNPLFGIKKYSKDNPNWKGGLKNLICKQCGKQFLREPSHSVGNYGKFCSIHCKNMSLYKGGKNATARRCYNKKKHNIRFKLRKGIPSLIRKYIKRRLISKMGKSTFSFLPYTVDELILCLEKQFKLGMTWENYGQWHIDHVIPDSSFNYKSVEDVEFQKCWALDNLQPLWAEENIKKGNKIAI